MRRDPDVTGSERDLILQYLDYQRETVLAKTEGLDRQAMGRRHPPSELTLAGLVLHLALVEENWSEVRFGGMPDREPWAAVDWDEDPNWEFRTAAMMEPADVRDRYRLACRRTRDVVAAAGDLEALSAGPLRDGRHFSLRWMLLHLIEETSRHAGHADLLREAADGRTGE